MRGGKREGAGRKGHGKTKTIRIPLELEAEIKELIKKHREGNRQNTKEPTQFEIVTKSKSRVLPTIKIINKDQIKRLRQWLIANNFCKSATEARKATESHRKCYEIFMKHIHKTEDDQNMNIHDILELYAFDE